MLHYVLGNATLNRVLISVPILEDVVHAAAAVEELVALVRRPEASRGAIQLADFVLGRPARVEPVLIHFRE